MPIKIGNLDQARRTAILIKLLKLDKHIDPQSCLSDQRFIKNFVNKIYGFSIGDLKEVAKTALSFALIRYSKSKQTEPLQKRDLEHALLAVYSSTKMGMAD